MAQGNKIRFSNNFSKGEQFTDTIGQVFVYSPELSKPDVAGKRFAYVMDKEASSLGVAQFNQRAAARTLARIEKLKSDVIRLGGQPLSDDIDVLGRQVCRLQMSVAARRIARLGYVHTFTSESGSMYFELETGDELVRVRISDHELPMHEERIYNHSVGRKCASREIIFTP